MPRTAGRTVVITGGSSGIGLTTARLMARHGWHIGLIARGEVGLQAASTLLQRDGARVATAAADVTDTSALRNAATVLEAELGPVDVWINNAAIGVFARFMDMTDEEFHRVTDVNYLGVVHGTRVALERFLPRNHGTVVNVCSAIGFRGIPFQSAYSGAKWAMRGFADAVRTELRHDGSAVRLSTVFPPSVNTPFYNHALGKLRGAPRPPPPVYQPEIVADAIHLAAVTGRKEVMVGGQTVMTAVLNTVSPSLTDWMLGMLGRPAQSTGQPGVTQQRDVNVFHPSSRFAGEHGAFDGEARTTSVQVWLTKHRTPVVAGLAAVTGLWALGRRR